MKARVWFDRYSTGYIGVVECDSDRILVRDSDTIQQIQDRVQRFIYGAFKAKEMRDGQIK